VSLLQDVNLLTAKGRMRLARCDIIEGVSPFEDGNEARRGYAGRGSKDEPL
jgi:hypothetical protein